MAAQAVAFFDARLTLPEPSSNPLLSVEDGVGIIRIYGPLMRDPDLIIRTAGEMRLSNFLIWQAAYAEFYFSEKLWPDFDPASLDEALSDYAGRQRRFGRTSAQVENRHA